jgi:hypothetical protein
MEVLKWPRRKLKARQPEKQARKKPGARKNNHLRPKNDLHGPG